MRRRSRTIITRSIGAVVFAMAMPHASAQERWMGVGDDGGPLMRDSVIAASPQAIVEEQGENGFDVVLRTPGLVLQPQTASVGVFVGLTWPEASVAGNVGAPAIPVYRRLFVAPIGAEVSVTTEENAPAVFTERDAGMPLRVVPVQPPIEKLPGARASAEFQYDAAAYAADCFLPAERARVQDVGMARGQRLMLLEARPVAYNAAKGEAAFWPELRIHVAFGEGRAPSLNLGTPSYLRGQVLNPDLLPPAPARATGNYLIIVPTAYESAIAAFASAKADQGFSVNTWVTPSSSTTTIKNYIQSLWGGPDSPDYVLLVGDTDTIQNWTGGGAGSPPTDLPYSCMDGSNDWYPDIPLGRFPIRSVSQLNAIVDKTLLYENGPMPDPDYVKRAVFMASNDNYTVSEGTHNWVIANYMIPNDIVSDKLYCHTYGATTQQVRNAFNAGRFYGVYSGHGSETYWADGPVFYQSDVNGLTNLGMYPFIASFACVTGNFTVQECFMETWVRAANKAAIIAIGSSVNSYWTEDDAMEKRLFDAIYDEEDDVPAEVGPVWNDARARYLAQMGSGSTTRRYFEMYNIMGDPALPFPNNVPRPPTAHSMSVSTAVDTAAVFALHASDDGLPEPPTLQYIITSLPTFELRDVGNNHVIQTGDLPYMLVNGGSQVGYAPTGGYSGADSFQFIANDGGIPPEGGESNVAIVSITVGGPDWNPVAHNVQTTVPPSTPSAITLAGTDPNGDPLDFVIESLPTEGEGRLFDPNAGEIESAPYMLADGGSVVTYIPPFGLTFTTSFTFSVHDATAASNVATASVTVGENIPQQVYSFTMDADPGWQTQGAWAFGRPTGGGTHNYDPQLGHTGLNVYGYNLYGDYMNYMDVRSLTTTAIDCSNLTETHVRFWRWLGVESFDAASVEASNDGTNWAPVWSSNGACFSDSTWVPMDLDLSSVADGHEALYIRWSLGPTDHSVTYPGWNIDDLEIWAIVNVSCDEVLPGDVDGSLAVDGLDVQPFVSVLLAPYSDGVSVEAFCAADTNADGYVTMEDLDGFIQVLLGE